MKTPAQYINRVHRGHQSLLFFQPCDTIWVETFITDFIINLVLWLAVKPFLVHKIDNRHLTKVPSVRISWGSVHPGLHYEPCIAKWLSAWKIHCWINPWKMPLEEFSVSTVAGRFLHFKKDELFYWYHITTWSSFKYSYVQEHSWMTVSKKFLSFILGC